MSSGTAMRADVVRATWRILAQPIGGPRLVLGRRWPALKCAARSIPIGAALPPDLRAIAASATRETGLWARERAEVMRELCSHFAEGLAAGRCEKDLVDAFGEPVAAGRMIGAARRRSRPLAYHISLRAAQVGAAAAVVGLGVYGVLAARFYTGQPGVAPDLRERLRPAQAAGEPAGWPLYREALMRLPNLPAACSEAAFWPDLWPGEAGWEELRAYLDACGPAMDLIRRGAAAPSVGRAPWDEAVARHLAAWRGGEDRAVAPPPDLGENSPLILERGGPTGCLRLLSWHVLADARMAISAGDAERFLADLAAIVGLAEQARAEPRVASDMLALLIYSDALYVATDGVLDGALLDDARLAEAAKIVAAFGGGGSLMPDLTGERLVVEDFFNRICDRDGRVTAAGVGPVIGAIKALAAHERVVRFPSMLGWMEQLGPAGAAVLASREGMLAEYDRLVGAALTEAASPVWTWRSPPGDAEHMKAREDAAWMARYAPVAWLHQNVGHVLDRAADAVCRRGALLTAVALERHRRRHGAYPASIDQLEPGLLASAPADRFTDGPIILGTRNGRPWLYSVGRDRDDDGGEPPEGPYGNTSAGTLADPRLDGAPPDGDWVLWPRTRFDRFGAPGPVPLR